MSKDGLTGKQRAFISAYLGKANFNATEAARMAGYSGAETVLASIGWENLRKPEISKSVEHRLKSAQMSADEVLSELADIARSDWREHVVTKVDRDGEEISATFLLKDKLKALELVGKAHKLFVDKVEHSNPDGTGLLQPLADSLNKAYGDSSEETEPSGS